MIVSFNPNVSNRKNQKPAFKGERSANQIKTTIQTALETNVPGLKITKAKAIERVHEAIRTEDKTGKSILRKFQAQVLERLP